jgi:hypothetical protein
MHPYLTKLGVRPEVQDFFHPYFTSDAAGNLVFNYQDSIEHFGFAFHRVPLAEHFWIAGDTNFSMIRQVFICGTAMDAIAYLSLNFSAFNHIENLLFLATGVQPNNIQMRWINQYLDGKMVSLIFSRDILGKLCDLKTATGIRRIPVAVGIVNEQVTINFRNQQYIFSQEQFSLNAFEKVSGYRFNTRTLKPKNFDSYLDQLKKKAFNQ